MNNDDANRHLGRLTRAWIPLGLSAALLLVAICESGAQPRPRPLAFRGSHFFIFDVKPVQRLSVTLTPVVAQDDYGPISYLVLDSKSRTLLEGEGIRGETPISFTIPDDAGDVAVLIVNGGRNWYQVDSPDCPYLVRASQLQPAHVTGDAAPFYFFVPKGQKSLRVYVTCDSPREGATVRILRPDGSEAATMTDQFDKPKPIEVRDAETPEGVWAIQLEHPRKHGADFSLDDVVLNFSANIPPFLALDRAALPGLILRHPEP